MESRQILGTRIDATTYAQAWDLIGQWIAAENWGYVVPANVHVVMSGVWHRPYQRLVNQAKLVTADGMPLVWALRALGVAAASRVYGPDLMWSGCAWAEKKGIPIYLYGSDAACLSQLQDRLMGQFPGLMIAGCHAPPFQAEFLPDDPDLIQDCLHMQKSGARLVFVGLGCPKQEEWMARYADYLPAIVLGVGAAFAFHSQQVNQAPRWLMALGLEWLFRLLQEPQRLWRRYLLNNPVFVVLLAWQILHQRHAR